MGALPKRKLSQRRKGKRRVDHVRKFLKQVASSKSRSQHLKLNPTS